MDIRFEPTKRTLVVKLSQDLDHHTAAPLRTEIDRKFRTTSASHIIFDMSSLRFMDSSGIGLVMGRYKLATPLGGRIYLTGIPKNMDRLLNMSGIYKLVYRAGDINQALKHISS